MTTQELSDILGISRATVSRVLNNNPNVKAETREKVLQAIQEKGYAPRGNQRGLVPLETRRIGVVVFSQPQTFWAQIKEGVDRWMASPAHEGITVDFFSNDILKPEEQITVVDRLIKEGYHGIALAPNNPTIMADAIDRAVNSGIPVVTFNSDIPNANRMAYVGSNYTRAGMLAAELIAKTIPGQKGNVALLTPEEPWLPIEQRTTGFRMALAEFPALQVSPVLRFPRVGGDVFHRTKELLTKGDIQAICITFGELNEVARAILATGMEGKIPVVGYDLDQQIAENLQKGAITATIGHEPHVQMFKALDMLEQYLWQGIQPQGSLHYTKLEIIMHQNADFYL